MPNMSTAQNANICTINAKTQEVLQEINDINTEKIQTKTYNDVDELFEDLDKDLEQ